MKRKIGRSAQLLTTVLMLGSLAACSGTGVPGAGAFQRIGDQSLRERSSDSRRTANEAVNFFAEAPVTQLQTPESQSYLMTYDRGQEVPNVTVGAINAAPMAFADLLNQVTLQAGMSWRVLGPQSGNATLLNRQVVYVKRSETSLKRVLDDIAELTDSFYKVEGDQVIFMQDVSLTIRVPRMANSQDILVAGLGNLGAQDIFADSLSGTVAFKADRKSYGAAKELLRSLEQGRDMVVYDFWIIDRNITDSAALGVDLSIDGLASLASRLTGGDLATGGTAVVDNILGGGADRGFISGNLGDIGVEATAQFLRSLGETETVARPTISMLSGGKSSFTNGEKSEYIRSVNSDLTDSGTSSGTDVRSLEVGVKIDVEGAHNNGVISTDFAIDVSELLSFEEFDTGTVTLRLPKTAQRTMNAHLEARPGDVMVLGGIIREREAKNAAEVPGIRLPTQRGRSSAKTETIILVRPRLVQIRPAAGAAPAGSMVVESGVGEIAPEANPISDVIVEEGQARDLLRRLKN